MEKYSLPCSSLSFYLSVCLSVSLQLEQVCESGRMQPQRMKEEEASVIATRSMLETDRAHAICFSPAIRFFLHFF